MDFWKGWPYPVAVGVLFVIVSLRAGGTYALGRAAGAGARRTRLAQLMARRGFARVQEIVARWGAPVVGLSFLTVGVQTLVNLAAGLTRMPLRRYVPALVIGSIIWAFLYATVGFVTFAAWRRLFVISPVAAITGLIALLLALTAYVIWQLRHRSKDSEPVAEINHQQA